MPLHTVAIVIMLVIGVPLVAMPVAVSVVVLYAVRIYLFIYLSIVFSYDLYVVYGFVCIRLCLDWPFLTMCLSGVVPQSGMVLLLFLLSFWCWTEHWPWLPGSLPCYSTWALPSLLGCVPSLVVAACISCLGSEPLECPFLSVVSGSPPFSVLHRDGVPLPSRA